MTRTPRYRRRLFLTMLRGSMNARRGRLALAAGAIAIGTSVAAALLLVSVDVGRKVRSELRAYGPNVILAPPTGELAVGAHALRVGAIGGKARFGPATLAWLDAERRVGRLGAYAPMRYAVARVRDQTIVLAGMPRPAALLELYPAARSTVGPDAGRRDAASLDASRPWIGALAAQRLGIRPGDSIALRVSTPHGTRLLTLEHVGVLEIGGANDQFAFVSSAALDTALGQAGRFHVALARVDGDARHVLDYAARAGAAAPAGALPPGAALRAVKRLTAADGEMMHRIRLLLVLVTAVALVAAALCAMSTLADLVLERTSEIALLRALGAGRGDLLSLFVGEAALLGLVGGLAGLAVGLVAAQGIGWGVFGSEIRPTPAVLPVTLVLGIVTAVFASIPPVREALAIEPARVLRGE